MKCRRAKCLYFLVILIVVYEKHHSYKRDGFQVGPNIGMNWNAK